MVKTPTCQCRRHKRCGFDSWQEDSLQKDMQATPVFLPGASHGQRSLVGYSPWGHKELDVTEHSAEHTYTYVWLKNPNSIQEKK